MCAHFFRKFWLCGEIFKLDKICSDKLLLQDFIFISLFTIAGVVRPLRSHDRASDPMRPGPPTVQIVVPQ